MNHDIGLTTATEIKMLQMGVVHLPLPVELKKKQTLEMQNHSLLTRVAQPKLKCSAYGIYVSIN